MTERVFNVLFLCTANSARSILAEAILNHLGGGAFRAFSAGSHPAGKVNPFAVELLGKRGLDAGAARSKSWDEFAAAGAPLMDVVVTVCDSAAGEVCPIWPGMPLTAHWGMEDPAAAPGGDEQKRKAFAAAFELLHRRISLFVGLPFRELDAGGIEPELRRIGRVT